ncbi:MAG: hypothetical protein A2Z14_05545 [Chloroflexi bacterium RBG_16_48_8]|nr:MAG: hypothetical protein A2Z14_05545 [Chloroflexi bacterium RBG_16_48_8]
MNPWIRMARYPSWVLWFFPLMFDDKPTYELGSGTILFFSCMNALTAIYFLHLDHPKLIADWG